MEAGEVFLWVLRVENRAAMHMKPAVPIAMNVSVMA